MKKVFYAPRRFDIKAARNYDEANSKIFPSSF